MFCAMVSMFRGEQWDQLNRETLEGGKLMAVLMLWAFNSSFPILWSPAASDLSGLQYFADTRDRRRQGRIGGSFLLVGLMIDS